ncbi:hypothetical protein E2C01_050283 [Portunus trituberculatus]|uniref:Uncharacterized protein n=1 Tax=Portunus trituberculatus TaxID=210409 RepID=A0A5B7GGW1_PORTR|nr:hypothetical protein [Portunus trituberculatus]
MQVTRTFSMRGERARVVRALGGRHPMHFTFPEPRTASLTQTHALLGYKKRCPWRHTTRSVVCRT